MDLRSKVIRSHRSGASVYAVVEEVHMGLATVRLSSSGSRLTSLSVIGNPVVPGQTVQIDYSTGVPPVVRALSTLSPEISGINLAAADKEDIGYDAPPDRGVCAIRRSAGNIEIPYNTTVDVPFEETIWDTSGFWNVGYPTRFYVPLDGLYLVIAHACFAVTENDSGYANDYSDYTWEGMPWRTFTIQLSNVDTILAMNRKPAIWNGNDETAFAVCGYLNLTAGEYIRMQVSHENPSSVSRYLLTDTTNSSYPRMIIQYRGEI